MELEFCCWFAWGGWEVSSVLHGNVFFVLQTHGLKTDMTHHNQMLCSVVCLAYLLSDLWTSVWECYVVCIPSCAQFTEDVCIWDAFA